MTPYQQDISERPVWLTTEELAAELRVSVATVHGWRRDRKGPEGRKFGKHVRYHRDAVDEWTNAQTHRSLTHQS